MIKAHGGVLINRIIKNEKRKKYLEKSNKMDVLYINFNQLMAVENIAVGIFSPLKGFLNEKDYNSVVERGRLSNGTVWTIPIVLGVKEKTADKLQLGTDIALYYKGDNQLYAILHLEDIYEFNREKEARMVYGTTDNNHPGVNKLYRRSSLLLGGKISLLKRIKHHKFSQYRLDPIQTREIIAEKGWRTVVAFQSRNPIHRAHEYLQKCALEIVDGLFISPLVGSTKKSDLSADIRIKSYEIVLEKYYSRQRYMMVVFPATMNYAGPKEAVFHALCRKNYGCTHFIVGRDHAGVGDFYGTYEAQEIFENFSENEIVITPLKFENAFYCRNCGNMATNKTCPHPVDKHIFLSGSKVREFLRQGHELPIEMTRPEVSKMLIEEFRQNN